MTNSLDPDILSLSPDLGPNCTQSMQTRKVAASKERVNVYIIQNLEIK